MREQGLLWVIEVWAVRQCLPFYGAGKQESMRLITREHNREKGVVTKNGEGNSSETL
jgi:hypothetical protein